MAELNMLVRIVAKPGEEEALIALMQTLRAASQAEPGVLRYEVMRDLEQGDTFYMQETYADKEAFKSHARSEHMAAYLRDSAELVAAVNMHKVAPIAP